MISNYNSLSYWQTKVVNLSSKIEDCISNIKDKSRVEITEDALMYIRHFVEKAMIAIYIKLEPSSKVYAYETEAKSDAFAYFLRNRNITFVLDFHNLLNKSPVGHDIVSYSDYSVRLFIGYFDSLVKIKVLIKSVLGIDVLNNLSQYPLNLDKASSNYYSKIQKEIINTRMSRDIGVVENYYISSKKMIFMNNHIFYEYSIFIIDDNSNKTDKIIAFSDLDIFDYYAVKLTICTKTIKEGNVSIDIDIILDYEIQIRSCEFKKLLKILGQHPSSINKTNEFTNLMNYIRRERITMSEIVKFDNKKYSLFAKTVFTSGQDTYLKRLFELSRSAYKSKVMGINTLMYLLTKTENNEISYQFPKDDEEQLKGTHLYLSKSVYPFETVPFCANLPSSIMSFNALIRAFDINDHQCEFIKREIDCIARDDGIIYNSIDRFGNRTTVLKYISEYNSKIRNYDRLAIGIIDFNGGKYIYSIDNENNTKKVFNFFGAFSTKTTIENYELYITSKMSSLGINLEDPNKDSAMKKMFADKSVFAVYGPAGTGKSYFANKVVELLDNYSILCLTTTYAAKGNLEKVIKSNKPTFQVIEKVIKANSDKYKKYDLVILDECSTISNLDMAYLVNKISPKLVLLLGDTYQIESIGLGNWFSLFRRVFSSNHYIDLDHCFRTNDDVLSKFWKNVREKNSALQAYMLNHQISHPLDEAETIFNYNNSAGTVTLCLNYNGLFGINNVNRIIQKNNPEVGVPWRRHIYKKGDPIIFKDNYLYSSIFFNNQKGTILDVIDSRTAITFVVEVSEFIEKEDAEKIEGVTVEYLPNSHTKVTFSVKKYNTDETDNDIKSAYVVPFSIGYAISIHKAQGLQFDKVRVIISSNSEDNITHNIFYTAITRAVSTVDIYWTAETENKIIKSFFEETEPNEFSLLVNRIFLPLGITIGR